MNELKKSSAFIRDSDFTNISLDDASLVEAPSTPGVEKLLKKSKS